MNRKTTFQEGHHGYTVVFCFPQFTGTTSCSIVEMIRIWFLIRLPCPVRMSSYWPWIWRSQRALESTACICSLYLGFFPW
jgi:hypothetical protein